MAFTIITLKSHLLKPRVSSKYTIAKLYHVLELYWLLILSLLAFVNCIYTRQKISPFLFFFFPLMFERKYIMNELYFGGFKILKNNARVITFYV